MLEFVCFKWRPVNGYRSTFSSETVNVLKRMIDRHYQKPHRLTCITDDDAGIDHDVRTIPLWSDYAHVASPHGGKNPSCYRRLKLFSREAADMIGPRFVAMDLDCVITGDLSPLVDRPEDFVCWGDTNPQPGSHYNGSFFILTAGSRSQVWDGFDPDRSPQQALKAMAYGSDQGWISYCLGPSEKKFTKADGVYSFRNDMRMHGTDRTLPTNSRLVVFHGAIDPWHPLAQRLEWVKQWYC